MSESSTPTVVEKADRRPTKISKHAIVDSEGSKSDDYLHGYRLIAVHGGMLTAVFLAALDQSIVSTAIPSIVSQFEDLERISWIVAAYFRMCPYAYRRCPCSLTL